MGVWARNAQGRAAGSRTGLGVRPGSHLANDAGGLGVMNQSHWVAGESGRVCQTCHAIASSCNEYHMCTSGKSLVCDWIIQRHREGLERGIYVAIFLPSQNRREIVLK